jgi:hypothetical protein
MRTTGVGKGASVNTPLNLEQLRKQAKELARERRDAGTPAKLSDAQLEPQNLRVGAGRDGSRMTT